MHNEDHCMNSRQPQELTGLVHTISWQYYRQSLTFNFEWHSSLSKSTQSIKSTDIIAKPLSFERFIYIQFLISKHNAQQCDHRTK